MDGTGIDTLNFFHNRHINLVSCGEQHNTYNADKKNVLHMWLNQDILQNAHMIVEDLYFIRDFDCTKSIIPRYFPLDKIYSCDDVREEFMIFSTDRRMSKEEKKITDDLATAAFLINPCPSPVLTKVDMNRIRNEYDRRVDEHNEKLPVPAESSDTPGLAYFIEKAYDCNNIFNRIINPRAEISKATLVDMVRTITKESNNINLLNPKSLKIRDHEIKMMFVYEFLMFQYITYNFIYRVARWIQSQKNSNLPPDQALYNRIYDTMQRIAKQIDITIFIAIIARMYDYIAILKVMELYDLEKVRGLVNTTYNTDGINATDDTTYTKDPMEKCLIWTCSGGAHNEFVDAFITFLFNEIGDPFTITKFVGSTEENPMPKINSTSISNIIPSTGTYTDAFSKFVEDNPHFGIVDNRKVFDVNELKTYEANGNLLEVFKGAVSAVYAHVKNKDQLLQILGNLDPVTLQLLIPLLISEEPISKIQLQRLTGKSIANLLNLGLMVDVVNDTVLADLINGDASYRYVVNPNLYILKNLKTICILNNILLPLSYENETKLFPLHHQKSIWKENSFHYTTK